MVLLCVLRNLVQHHMHQIFYSGRIKNKNLRFSIEKDFSSSCEDWFAKIHKTKNYAYMKDVLPREIVYS